MDPFTSRNRAPRPEVRRSRSRAFTLLETMMALVIIGVGVLAFVDANTSFSRTNAWSSQAATGMLLANEIREFTRRLPRHDPVTLLTLTGSGGTAVVNGWGRETGEYVVTDIDDIDDLDGVRFGEGGTFPGPTDAFGHIVPAISPDGAVVMDIATGEAVPLAGWTQQISVTKVDPYNFNTVRAPNYEQPAAGVYPKVAVDQFPLRITVIVSYRDLMATQSTEVTRLTWVVSP